MEDQTQIITKGGQLKESSIFGVSIRGWCMFLLVATVCANQLICTTVAGMLSYIKADISFLGSQSAITEPLYGLAYMAVGYYFAKMNQPKAVGGG